MILLDTHVWLRWLLPGEPLPQQWIERIEQAETVFVSAVSCWEIVMLERRKRVDLPLPVEEWLDEATAESRVDVLPVTCEISRLSGLLPEHHKDPADRIIIATAVYRHLSLLSFDSAFPLYQELSGLLPAHLG
jgi:PIN domain nuclease of toxin-antitoxin system